MQTHAESGASDLVAIRMPSSRVSRVKETKMATTPTNDEPGFAPEINELPDEEVSENTAEDRSGSDKEADALEKVQEQAAEDRKQGGYQ
jgi:hypothetical protein